MSLVIEFFAHLDAGDRRVWTADQDTRPLSELGRRQAEALCAAVGSAPVDALYSSAALRCVQSMQPLVTRYGLRVTTLTGLHETDGWLPPRSWRAISRDIADAVGGAFAAGRAVRVFSAIQAEHPAGRVAACTHGDVLPALIGYLQGAHGLDLPAYNATRGGWYTLRFDASGVSVEHHGVLPGFPL